MTTDICQTLPQKEQKEARAEVNAYEGQYGRLRINIQTREQGGYDILLVDRDGSVVARTFTPESDLERAKDQAVDEARQFLAE